jgi:hypothetical protein
VGGNAPSNLFTDLPAQSRDEEFVELLARKGVRIERIVSTAQSTPADAPYDQDHDEWVLLLRGARVCGSRVKRNTFFGLVTISSSPPIICTA